MNIRIHVVTLATDNLARAGAFYAGLLGYPEPEPGAELAAFGEPGGVYLVLVNRAEFASYADRAGAKAARPGKSSSVLSYFTGSRTDVDALLQRAGAAGAAIVAAKDEVWGYAGFFTDPDGQIWEVVHNPQFSASQA